MIKSLLISFFMLAFFKSCDQRASVYVPKVDAPPRTQLLCGLNFVAPPNAFIHNPMEAVLAVNANWIAVIPYAFTRKETAAVYYNTDRQWWGEREVGVRETIRLANQSGVKVVLKPQVYIPGSWTGDLDFQTSEEWEKWESDYSDYIMTFAKLAAEMEVPVFCIGTEFKISARKRAAYWRDLIRRVRSVYNGKLIYAANWDEYMDVPFWDDLEFVGINAYFPLDDAKTPSVSSLNKAWLPYRNKIRQFYNKTKKPIVFTEFGYLSVDGCAHNTWELESKVKNLAVNEEAQANAIRSLLDTFWEEPYWHGGFIWKWFPNMKGGEGYNSKDYTPQGKKGHQVLKEWYAKKIKE